MENYEKYKKLMSYDSFLMCQAGLQLPCKSVQTGQFRKDLVDILRPHIIYMVNHHTCNHNGFKNGRAEKIMQVCGGSPMEVVAMHSGMASNPESAAKQLFNQWYHSPPHWHAINSVCRYYCYCLGQSGNSYYGIGIVIK